MKLLRSIVVSVFTILVIPASRAETMELKFGHVGAPGSLFVMSAEEFVKRANEALDGKAKVTVFGAGQWGVRAKSNYRSSNLAWWISRYRRQ